MSESQLQTWLSLRVRNCIYGLPEKVRLSDGLVTRLVGWAEDGFALELRGTFRAILVLERDVFSVMHALAVCGSLFEHLTRRFSTAGFIIADATPTPKSKLQLPHLDTQPAQRFSSQSDYRTGDLFLGRQANLKDLDSRDVSPGPLRHPHLFGIRFSPCYFANTPEIDRGLYFERIPGRQDLTMG